MLYIDPKSGTIRSVLQSQSVSRADLEKAQVEIQAALESFDALSAQLATALADATPPSEPVDNGVDDTIPPVDNTPIPPAPAPVAL